MQIFITGASGYIGGTVALALLAAGHRVRGLVRSEATAAQLAAIGIDPIVGTLDDAEMLEREASASDGVINAASADHADALRSLVHGLEHTGKPLLHTSGSSIVGDEARGAWRSETVYDEDTPLQVSALKQPRRDIDLQVLGAAAQGVRAIVICPSLIYGLGRGLNRHSVQLPLMAAHAQRRGAVQLVGAGLNVWSNVHIDDVADLYLRALNDAPAGAFYFAENGEASFAEVGAAIATRLGLGTVDSLAPDEAARLWGEARAWYSLGSNSRVRAARARRELGWSPRHSSVVDWILREMPVPDPNALSN